MRILGTVMLLSLMASSAHAAEFASVRSITVSGQAEEKLLPDEAHLSVHLNSMAPQLAAAKSAHDGKLKKLLALLGDAGIAEKKIKTESSSTAPEYDYTNGKNRLRGYRAQTQLDVTVQPIEKVGALMERITQAGFEQGAAPEWGALLSVRYTLAEPDKARDALLAKAIENAHAKAQNMARAAGASLGPVLTLSEEGAPEMQFARPMMMESSMVGGARMADAPITPPTGETPIAARVTVSYELR